MTEESKEESCHPIRDSEANPENSESIASSNNECWSSRNFCQNSDKFDIITFLEERLDRSYYNTLYQQQKQKKSKGRKRIFRDTHKEAIWNSILTTLCKRAQKTKSERKDAQNASICRGTKKLASYILQYASQRSLYKSSNIEKYTGAYAEAFTVGFIPTILEGVEIPDKILVFCQFIVLEFPEQKVKRIIQILYEGNYLSIDERKNLLHQLQIRKLPSKTSFHNLASKNICFKNMILKLLPKLDSTSIQNQPQFRYVLVSLLEED